MKRASFWILLVATAIIAGSVYFYSGWRQSSEQTASTPSPTQAEVDVSQTPSDPPDEAVAPEPQRVVQDDFVFKRLNIDTTEELPAACLVFSRELDASGTVRYEDYVRFDNGELPALSVQSDQLCIAGLAFSSEYRVTLRKDMPSADGKKLLYDENIPISLTDRPAMVEFGEGLILPRGLVDGVPITTVNVSTLDIPGHSRW